MGGVPLKRPMAGIDPDMPALPATGGLVEEDGLEPKKCKHRTSPHSKAQCFLCKLQSKPPTNLFLQSILKIISRQTESPKTGHQTIL